MTSPADPPAAPDNAAGVKHKGESKTARVFAKYAIQPVAAERLRKPDWIRVRAASSPRFNEIKTILREHRLHTGARRRRAPTSASASARAPRRS